MHIQNSKMRRQCHILLLGKNPVEQHQSTFTTGGGLKLQEGGADHVTEKEKLCTKHLSPLR